MGWSVRRPHVRNPRFPTAVHMTWLSPRMRRLASEMLSILPLLAFEAGYWVGWLRLWDRI